MSPEDYIIQAVRNGNAAPTSVAGVIKAAPAVQEKAAHPVALSPAQRRLARLQKRMFSAGNVDRLTFSWGATPLSADDVVEKHQRILVARSREQAAANDYVKAFIRMCRQNIVGPHGVTLQAQTRTASGKLAKDDNQALEDAWWSWGNRKNCDITGRQSWRAIQAACVEAAAKDGEAFVRLVWGKNAGPWGFALQIIDAQRCPVDHSVDLKNGTGDFIRQGIKFNRYGRPLSYFFTTTDDTEATYYHNGKKYVEVPADQIVHLFRMEMVGQKRGLPWTATSLFRAKHLGAFEEAAVVNARVGAAKMGFIQWKEGYGPKFENGDDVPEIDAEAGVFETLPEGAELNKWEPQFPSGELAIFSKHMLRGMAAGFGVPYNELAADLEGVNFSSIRQGTLDSREHWKELQEWLIEQLIHPVFEAWLERALLGGRIKTKTGRLLNPAKVDVYSLVTWQPRRWQWIDPRADVEAAVTAKNNGLTSPGQIIREQGRDPQTVWEETAADIRAQMDAMKAQGIPDEIIAAIITGQKTQPKPEAPQP